MQGSSEEKHSPYQESDLETKLSRDLCEQLNFNSCSQDFHEEEVEKETTENDMDDLVNDEDEEEEEEEEEEEFSFTCGRPNTSPIAAEDAFLNGQIKPIFPLSNRDFFSTGDESDSLHKNLPRKPPVKKFFVETKNSGASSGDDANRPERKAVEVSPEACKKSNSTGFSKIWRFKDFLGRSNSDGRDAFVFLNDNPPAPPMMAVSGKEEEMIERKVPANKGKKGKTASLSAHEVYMRSKAKDGEKRRSYLPYRPELMGFFTNVNSGLSKNVHPY